MVIVRYLFVLLVGFLAGAGTMVWLANSGTGDLIIQRTAVVQDLEKRLREMEQERDRLGRQLEDVVARSERMQGSFEELERRFKDMAETHQPAPTRGTTPPGSDTAPPPPPPAPMP
jgi:uncharacterized coiled-coil protein SlyX